MNNYRQSTKHINENLHAWYLNNDPRTPIFGLARSILALASLITLIINPTNILFRNVAGLDGYVTCSTYNKISLFCIVGDGNLEIARLIAILILLLVLSGIYPRLTSILHWWVAFSLATSARVIDGGDQVAQNLALFLMVVGVFDNRRSHWGSKTNATSSYSLVFASSAWILAKLQVIVIYFDAAIEKAKVAEWKDGTALYYFFASPYMGLPNYQKPFLDPVLGSWLVAPLTWSVIALEILLAISWLLPSIYRKFLFFIGLLFHLGIIVFLGVSSFGVTMIGALIILLVPVSYNYSKLKSLVFNSNRSHKQKIVRTENVLSKDMEV